MEVFDEIIFFRGDAHGVIHDHIARRQFLLLHQRHAHKLLGDLASGRINKAQFAIGAGGGDGLAIRAEAHGIHAAARDFDAAQQFDILRHISVQFRSLAAHRLDDLFHRLGQGAVIVGRVNVHRAVEVMAGTDDDALAVRSEPHREDAALHHRELADEIGVVADHALGDALQAIDLRHPIGAAHQHFITQRMPRNGMHTALQGTGRDRSNIVNEALRVHFRELHRHVTAAGHEMLAIHTPDRVQHPVAVAAHEQHLLACRGVNAAHRVVRATHGDELAVWRPARPIQTVEGVGHGKLQLLLGHVPYLQFARARRTAARDGEPFAIRRENHFLNALGQPHQPRRDAAAIGLVNEDFMVACDRDELAVG